MVLTADSKKSKNSTNKPWNVDDVKFFIKAIKMKAQLTDKKFPKIRDSVNNASSYDRKQDLKAMAPNSVSDVENERSSEGDLISKKSKNFNFEIAKVLFPRKKEAEDEIDLFKDELITILSKHDETVWIGRKENNEKGFFPSDFVEIIRNIQTIPLENNSTLNKN